MTRCCLAIGVGAVLGLLLAVAALRVSENFDTQLIHF